MAEFKLGTVTTLAGPISIPEVSNEPVILFSIDDDYTLYAIPNNIYEKESFKPNDNVSFALQSPNVIPLKIQGDYPLIVVKGITFIKKYKEVR